MGGAVSKRVKARRKKAAAAAALRCPRLKPLSFSLPCDATNIRGGDLLALVPDKDAARAVARELRSTPFSSPCWLAVRLAHSFAFLVLVVRFSP